MKIFPKRLTDKHIRFMSGFRKHLYLSDYDGPDGSAGCEQLYEESMLVLDWWREAGDSSETVHVNYAGEVLPPDKIYDMMTGYQIEHNGTPPTFKEILSSFGYTHNQASGLSGVMERMAKAGLLAELPGSGARKYSIAGGVWTAPPRPHITYGDGDAS